MSSSYGGTDDGEIKTIRSSGSQNDAFGRSRISELFGIWVNKNVSSRNRNQWEEKITGGILVYNTLIGTFTVTEEIRGVLPADNIAIATVATDNGSTSMTFNGDHNDFQVGDTITGQTSGATAVIVSVSTGSDIQFNYNHASVDIKVGITATDSAIRQTHRYHSYVPGKSQLILMTGVMGVAKTNVTQRMGLYDSLDGIFLSQTISDTSISIRSSTSGVAVDNTIIQSDWNIDKLDGLGESGITLDLSKSQILVIDYQWLGVGRVRVGFDIDGLIFYVHEFLHANNLNVVYMRTPSLPVRYEIFNTGIPASPTILEEICSSVSSEGGFKEPGLEFTVFSPIAGRTVGTTRTPVLAIRLKNQFPTGKENRRIIKFIGANIFASSNAVRFEVAHIHEPIDITATWVDVGGGSSGEFSSDITAVTGRPEHVISGLEAGVAQGNKGQGDVINGEFINLHSFIAQGIDAGVDDSELLVIYATAHTSTALVRTHLTFLEFE